MSNSKRAQKKRTQRSHLNNYGRKAMERNHHKNLHGIAIKAAREQEAAKRDNQSAALIKDSLGFLK